MGAKLPTARKTGTTICGIVFKVRFYFNEVCLFECQNVYFLQDIFCVIKVMTIWKLHDHVLTDLMPQN